MGARLRSEPVRAALRAASLPSAQRARFAPPCSSSRLASLPCFSCIVTLHALCCCRTCIQPSTPSGAASKRALTSAMWLNLPVRAWRCGALSPASQSCAYSCLRSCANSRHLAQRVADVGAGACARCRRSLADAAPLPAGAERGWNLAWMAASLTACRKPERCLQAVACLRRASG